MMNEIIIREATMADLPGLLQFEQGVIAAERPFDPTLKDDPNKYYDLEEMIHASHIRLVVARHEDNVIGSGYARIESAKPYLKHKEYAYLGFMYVLPAFRGRGVNKLIIDDLRDWAASRKIFEIRLDVYDKNENAIRAYEKVGFSRYMINMRLESAPGSPQT